MIEIKCKTKEYLPINDLVDLQGNLKKLSKKNLRKLENQIKEKGFIAPFFVWKNDDKNFVLDGHQRLSVLKEIRKKEPEILPESFPVVFIEAKDRIDAKEKLLAINSQYGEMTADGIYEFFNENEVVCSFEGLENLSLPVNFDPDKYLEKMEMKNDQEPEFEISPNFLERHDYIILYFDNQLDFASACDRFNIKTVKLSDHEKWKRRGVGRVIPGKFVMNMIEGKK